MLCIGSYYARRIYLDTFFFFNDTATTEIYTLSLHDALPIYMRGLLGWGTDTPTPTAQPPDRFHPPPGNSARDGRLLRVHADPDRKSTRLNSSHANISYAVFCLKKKTK